MCRPTRGAGGGVPVGGGRRGRVDARSHGGPRPSPGPPPPGPSLVRLSRAPRRAPRARSSRTCTSGCVPVLPARSDAAPAPRVSDARRAHKSAETRPLPASRPQPPYLHDAYGPLSITTADGCGREGFRSEGLSLGGPFLVSPSVLDTWVGKKEGGDGSESGSRWGQLGEILTNVAVGGEVSGRQGSIGRSVVGEGPDPSPEE